MWVAAALLCAFIAGMWIGFIHGSNVAFSPERHIGTDRLGKIFMHTILTRGHEHFEVANESIEFVDGGHFDRQLELQFVSGQFVSVWRVVKK